MSVGKPVEPISPEARVGKTANVVIFLGILSAVMALLGLVSEAEPAQRWATGMTLGVAVGIIGLGYGIRAGSLRCLYIATGVFAGLTGYLFYMGVSHGTLRPLLRLLLSGWAVFLLCRALPAMQVLKQTQSKPLQTSRFGEFFLRHKAK
jgi:hypothetical protein